MTYSHSFVLDVPIDEVFAWQARPGALTRLLPPWQPATVEAEADSLRDGTAVLRLPGGIRVTTHHQPDGYDPPRAFVDQLDRPRWRHTHRLEPVDADHTQVTDSVDTALPGRFLKETFAYRERQLAGDLTAHRAARPSDPADAGRRLTIAMTGSSGLIGTALAAYLGTGGHHVVRLVRGAPGHKDEQRHWDPQRPAPDLLDGIDALVHLAGEPLAGRFTERHKQRIRDSRVGPTRRLAELIATRANETVMVSSSAIGVYGADRGDELLDESSARGEGLLADMVADWEAATGPARDAGARVVNIRTGIVQSPNGGSLRLLLPLFRAGGGGRLGDGRQWLSWIGIDDLLDIYLGAIVDPGLHGPLNAVAPNPIDNREYTATLGRVLRRPTRLPVPSFGPRLLLGAEGAAEIATASQRVVPKRLLDAGHRFRHPQLEANLRHLLGRTTR